MEMQQFLNMVVSKESLSLRNLFFAERAALKVRVLQAAVQPFLRRARGAQGKGTASSCGCATFYSPSARRSR